MCVHCTYVFLLSNIPVVYRLHSLPPKNLPSCNRSIIWKYYILLYFYKTFTFFTLIKRPSNTSRGRKLSHYGIPTAISSNLEFEGDQNASGRRLSVLLRPSTSGINKWVKIYILDLYLVWMVKLYIRNFSNQLLKQSFRLKNNLLDLCVCVVNSERSSCRRKTGIKVIWYRKLLFFIWCWILL